MGRMRKSAVQIRFEILEFLFFNAKPQLRTSVWRKSTNLSYDDFLKHLTYLKDKNFVKETEESCYILTDEGRRLYLELRRSLPSILQDAQISSMVHYLYQQRDKRKILKEKTMVEERTEKIYPVKSLHDFLFELDKEWGKFRNGTLIGLISS